MLSINQEVKISIYTKHFSIAKIVHFKGKALLFIISSVSKFESLYFLFVTIIFIEIFFSYKLSKNNEN